MGSSVEIGSLIERIPGHCGGRPKIAGTRMTVGRIAGRYKLGMTPEEIAAEFEGLNLAQVYAALAYYHGNREEIEADWAEDDAAELHWKEKMGVPSHRG